MSFLEPDPEPRRWLCYSFKAVGAPILPSLVHCVEVGLAVYTAALLPDA